MNRIYLMFLTTILLAFTSNAQLKVISTGQVQVGETEYEEETSSTSSSGLTLLNPIPTGTGYPTVKVDTTAALRIIGPAKYETGGKIAFGQRDGVYICENSYEGGSLLNPEGFLIFGGKGGLTYKSGNETIFSYDKSLNLVDYDQPFTFFHSVVAPVFLTSSDSRLKTDIESIEDKGELLDEISPVSYVLKIQGEEGEDSNSKSRSSSERKPQYGFLAQEVREVYPDLVYEDAEGMLSVDYTGFIAILVDAVKGLRTQVKAQKEAIDSLKSAMNGDPLSVREDVVLASLSQNRPNPFRSTTTISCVIPETVSNAFICVYDLNGSQKLRKDIPLRGNTDVTIDGNTLTAGMYIYALICDGMEIDSKRMILTD